MNVLKISKGRGSCLESCRKDNTNITNFLNFSYAVVPTVTNSHSCICHTTSVHRYHQLWGVALCCIVMMFATLKRNRLTRKTKKSFVNSLLCLFLVLLLFVADWGDAVKTYSLISLLLLLKCSLKEILLVNFSPLSHF